MRTKESWGRAVVRQSRLDALRYEACTAEGVSVADLIEEALCIRDAVIGECGREEAVALASAALAKR